MNEKLFFDFNAYLIREINEKNFFFLISILTGSLQPNQVCAF